MMHVFPTDIDGCFVLEPHIFYDNRGSFSEIFNEKNTPIHFQNTHSCQANISVSQKWVFRGMHFQKDFPQAKLIRVLRWKILDFIFDIRPHSPTFWKGIATSLSAESGKQIFVPRGCVHGFLSLMDETEVLYFVDNKYYPQGESWFSVMSADFGVNFSEIQNKFSIEKFIFSQKDEKLPPLSDIL